MKKLTLFLVCILSAALFLTSSCKKDNSNSLSPSTAGSLNPSSAKMDKDDHAGYVYTESNETDTNRILVFRHQHDGTLTLGWTVASGGSGTGSGLGSQSALALDKDYDLLIVVNAGNNTISSFKVRGDGSLSLSQSISSGGTLPISVTIHDHYAYVLNATSNNINGFEVKDDGKMSAIAGSQQSLSAPGTSPEQISFSPEGKFVYVTEKAANIISSFAINDNGKAKAGVFIPSVGMNPYGFAFAHHFMVVSNAEGGNANASTVTSYKGANDGKLQSVNGAVADSETAACWLATTNNGHFAYTCNAGSNNISLYAVSDDGKLTLLMANAAPGNHPLDIIVTKNDAFVYNLNTGNQTIGEFSRASDGSLTNLGYVAGLPASATGLAGF